MIDREQQIETVQQWVTELQRNKPATDAYTDQALANIIKTIHHRPINPPVALAVIGGNHKRNMQGQARTTVLKKVNQVLRRRVSVLSKSLLVRDLAISRLKLLLQEQIRESKHAQSAERDQRAWMEALRDTVATMSSTLALDKVLDHILDSLNRVTPYDGANVLYIESDLVHVVSQRGYVDKDAEKEWLKQRIPITQLAALQQLMDIGKPLAIPETTTSALWIGFPGQPWIHSNVIAPIRLNDEILGFLSVDSATPGFFTQADAERVQAFADQAAIAIQNSRLYERAKRTAVQEERNRLTNELHDTISQTLWSMSLISERLPAIWDIDAAEGRRGLETLHELTRSAVAEMRSLLMELRPSIFMDTKLGDLIQQFASVIGIRSGLVFSVQIKEQHPVTPAVQMAIYRVVQEALNNVIHHASATHVDIFFSSQPEQLELTICDDGRGFNPDQIAFGHLGLGIMIDRIATIGATVEVISNAGKGTCINVLRKTPIA